MEDNMAYLIAVTTLAALVGLGFLNYCNICRSANKLINLIDNE